MFLYRGYLDQGFLALQHSVDAAIIEHFGRSVTVDVREMRLRRFPYPPYMDDKFVLIIQQQLPLIIVLSFIFCALQIVKEVVHEKEQKLKAGLITYAINSVYLNIHICKMQLNFIN